jgi:hypothetical protein
MKPKELTVRGLILGTLIVGRNTDAPIGLVADDFVLGPWLGGLLFIGMIVLLYGWMLNRANARAA